MAGDTRRSGLTRRTFVAGAGLGAAGLTLGLPGRARAAGAVMHYAGGSANSVDALCDAFAKKTGQAAEFWRAGGVNVVQKVEAEFKAGRVLVDVIGNTEVEAMIDWAEQGNLMKYDSPEASHFPAQYRMPGYWVPQKVLLNTISYNTQAIKADEAPKHWADLADPRWKGKIVILDWRSSGSAVHMVYALRKLLGKDFAAKMAKQDVMLKRGGGDTSNSVISGERPIGVGLQEYYVFDKAKKGAPIAAVLPEEGVPMTLYSIAIPKGAPNPEAAKRFVDFALGREAQAMWQERFGTPVLRDDVPPYPRMYGLKPMSEVKIIFSSIDDLKEEGRTKREFFEEWKQVSG